MTVLAFEENAATVVNGEHDHGAGMPNHVASRADPAGLFYLVGGDVKNRPLKRDAGREGARTPGSFRFSHRHQYNADAAASSGRATAPDGILARVNRKPRIAIVGAGRLASVLAPALREAGYSISEIVSRNPPGARKRSQILGRRVGANATTVSRAALDCDLLWFCVPDREIRRAADAVAAAGKGRVRFVFHSSGALLSRELDSLRKRGSAAASVHPLMTFVTGSQPALDGVPFALEGDAAAVRLARRIVRDLGGESFSLRPSGKAAYHTWAMFTSPLWLAFLVTLEEAARGAGLKANDARRMCQPILRQTLENYLRLGPGNSFSGPIIRGDTETVAKHLAVLRKHPRVREVYVALARVALDRLPARNKPELRRLLQGLTGS